MRYKNALENTTICRYQRLVEAVYVSVKIQVRLAYSEATVMSCSLINESFLLNQGVRKIDCMLLINIYRKSSEMN